MLVLFIASLALAGPLQTDQEARPTGADLDPDGPWVGYGHMGGRWQAHVGTHLGILGGDGRRLSGQLGLQGFLELQNFEAGYPISFQSFRAHVGLEGLLWSPAVDARLPPGGRATLRIGWAHESDHVASLPPFVEAWVDVDRAYALGEDPYSFYDNDNVSSYEHLHATLRWDQPWGEGWAFALALTPRVFTPDLNPWARRELTHGFGAELRLRRQLTARGALAVGGRWERWWHAFDPVAVGLRAGLGVDPSTWARAELAWEQAPRPDRVWVPWLGLSDGNGRGSDFFVDHGLEWGAGLRVHR